MSSNMTSSEYYTEYYLAQDQGTHILAACWLMTALATVVVVGRFYIRYRLIKRGGADDWWMLGGLAFLCTLTGLITAIAQIGGFKHESTLTPETIEHVKKLFWTSQPIGLIGSLLPKISIGLQLLFIMPTSGSFKWQRQVVWICMIVAGVTNVIVFPMVFTQCNPTTALWTEEAGAHCWNTNVNTIYFTVAALINAVVDFIFAAIPIGVIMNLKISFVNKALLINFLGARMFAFIAGVTKASYIAKNGFAVGDFTWNAFDFLLWQTAEQFCLCFCGSFPTYKALFDRWLKKRASLKASGYSGYSSRPASPPPAWFYEHKCFDKPYQDEPELGQIHYQREFIVERTERKHPYERTTSSVDDVPLGGTSTVSNPSSPKRFESKVEEASYA